MGAKDSLSDIAACASLLLEGFADGALLVEGETGKIIVANDGALHLLGYSREELLELTVEDLIPPSLKQSHERLRDKFLAGTGARSMAPDRRVRARLQDGTDIFVKVSIGEVTSSHGRLVMAVFRNVDQTVAFEQSMAHVLNSLDFIEIGLIVLGANPQVIVHANESARTLTGYSLDELVGQPLGKLGVAILEEGNAAKEELKESQYPREVSEQVLLRSDSLLVPVQVEFARLNPDYSDDQGLLMIFRDLHSRRKVEALRRTSKLRQSETQRLQAIARERDRIARDFHDTVIQEIFGTGLVLQSAAVGADGPVRERIERSIASLDEVIAAIRRAIFDLQVSRPEEDAVRVRFLEVVEWGEQLLGFSCDVKFEGATAAITSDCEQDLLSVLREALANVGKHSGATAVSISLSVDFTVQLTVSDNGRGFNMVGSSPRGENYGLANMAARAESHGGVFDFETGESGGTQLRWEVPIASLEE